MTHDSSTSDNNTSSGDSSDECLSNHNRLSNSSSPESTPQKILNKIQLDTPPQSVQNSPSSRDGISFESMCRESSSQDGVVSSISIKQKQFDKHFIFFFHSVGHCWQQWRITGVLLRHWYYNRNRIKTLTDLILAWISLYIRSQSCQVRQKKTRQAKTQGGG